MHDKPFQMEVCIEGGTKDGHRGHDPYPTYRKKGGVVPSPHLKCFLHL